jgi:5-methyltetrahydrofolate--homocysteine methyltransferase
MEPMALDELLAALDRRAVIRSRWAYADEAEGSAALEEAIRAVRAAGGVEAACRYGFFKARRLGDDIVAFSDGAGAAASFRFPRERADAHRSVADFFAPEDAGAAFCVTLGRAAVDYLAASRASGDSSAYLRAHGLLAGLAEAAAELAHGRLAQELAGRGASPKGKRYSFGFPGCPGVEANPPLLALLGAAAIGLRATEGYQLEPEFSVTAIVVQRSAAVYISA